jgi:hypothetical protein
MRKRSTQPATTLAPDATPSSALHGAPCDAVWETCPVLADAARITDLAQDLQHAMRRLRRDLNRCKTCPAGEQCPVLQNYQAQISRAIAEVLSELTFGS